jgi:hypothetical protein
MKKITNALKFLLFKEYFWPKIEINMWNLLMTKKMMENIVEILKKEKIFF